MADKLSVSEYKPLPPMMFLSRNRRSMDAQLPALGFNTGSGDIYSPSDTSPLFRLLGFNSVLHKGSETIWCIPFSYQRPETKPSSDHNDRIMPASMSGLNRTRQYEPTLRREGCTPTRALEVRQF